MEDEQSTNATPPTPPPEENGEDGIKLGRIKAPPFCAVIELQQTATPTEELQKGCFVFATNSNAAPVIDTPSPRNNNAQAFQRKPGLGSSGDGGGVVVSAPPAAAAGNAAAAAAAVAHHHGAAIPISSCSSTCTRESELSDAEGGGLLMHNSSGAAAAAVVRVVGGPAKAATTTTTTATPPPKLQHQESDRLNAKVSLRKESRQGRSTQRWLLDNHDESLNVRLVTGCVPILQGGQVLLVSASRKAEWILPKGGWELDETIQESAIRESFEEAGVLGILGPALDDIQYETRKAKKRRRELEEQQQKQQGLKKAPNAEESSGAEDTAAMAATDAGFAAEPLTEHALSRIQHEGSHRKDTDETLSNGSTRSSSYSHVRMTLFPLYVSQVLEEWPEQGRLRKAMDIDEAIAAMEARPEFKAVLEQIKARGLHVYQPTAGADDQRK